MIDLVLEMIKRAEIFCFLLTLINSNNNMNTAAIAERSWAAAIMGAHTAWFALKLPKELYNWFIFLPADWLFCELVVWISLVRKRIILYLFWCRKRNADYAHRSKNDYSTCMRVIVLCYMRLESVLAQLKTGFENTAFSHRQSYLSLLRGGISLTHGLKNRFK